MKSIFVAAGVIALAFGGTAYSKPGNGHGNGNFGHAYGRDGPVGYGVGGCPPGLARKGKGCMPPGQAKKLFQGPGLVYGSRNRYGYRHVSRAHMHAHLYRKPR